MHVADADHLHVPRNVEAGFENRFHGASRRGIVIPEDAIRARVEREGSTIGQVQSGDFFGELALIEEHPRSATVVASERAVERYGLEPLARVTAAATAGVPPRIMGIGPVPATRKLLGRTGLEVGQLDVVELNEAFAAQSLAVLRQLGLPDDAEHVNPNGGAIALGHPLGASGARLVLTAALELGVRDARRALATMCIGVGQGISVLLERAG
jgi:acetyl-CoA acetyltransferase